MKTFDRKFGRDFLAELPTSAAVYLFRDERGEVLYVGKAKNVRRRLAQYRNASRRKAHRKMRTLVREADRVEVRPQPGEAEALLAENQLIRELRPRYNVDGAFDFLYPAIGTGSLDDRLVLCFTTDLEAFAKLDLRWHGSYRPRWRAREAFDALVRLFAHLGHAEPRSRLPAIDMPRGSRLFAIRRAPTGLLASTRRFLDGEETPLLAELTDALLERPSARGSAREIEAHLRALDDFHRTDAKRLREAQLQLGMEQRFVPQSERDALFIRARRASSGAHPEG